MNGNQANIDRIVSLVTERLKRLHSPGGDVTVAPPHATNNNANSEHAGCSMETDLMEVSVSSASNWMLWEIGRRAIEITGFI